MNNFNTIKELTLRLTRIESKLARGFEELGVNINTDRDWLSVDDSARVVYVATMGRSLMVILADMAQRGATHIGDIYEVVHRGEVVGTLVFNPPFQNI